MQGFDHLPAGYAPAWLAENAGATVATLPPALAAIAVPTRQGGGAPRAEDYAVTAGWGRAGREGVVMPGRGRIAARPYAPDEAATEAAAA